MVSRLLGRLQKLRPWWGDMVGGDGIQRVVGGGKIEEAARGVLTKVRVIKFVWLTFH